MTKMKTCNAGQMERCVLHYDIMVNDALYQFECRCRHSVDCDKERWSGEILTTEAEMLQKQLSERN